MISARVDLNERVKITVPLELKGTPKGEADGGVLQQIIADLEIECLVTDIPDVIRYNVSELGLNAVLHIKDLILPPRCEGDAGRRSHRGDREGNHRDGRPPASRARPSRKSSAARPEERRSRGSRAGAKK